MAQRVPIFHFDRLFDALPGWMCVAGGAVLLGLFVLTPQWLACREVAWNRDLMRLQARALTEQRDQYQQFHDALRANDPVLIERLAFTELRQKQVGHDLFDAGPDVLLAYNTELIPDDPGAAPLSAHAATTPGSVHAWLRVRMPVVGQDLQPLRPIESHLTRIVGGPFRLIAVIAAVGVMTMGVLFQVRPGESTGR